MPPFSAIAYSIFFALVVLILWFVVTDKYAGRIARFGLWFVLVLFSALRYNVGRDYPTYETAINNYYSSHNEHMEWIWNWFREVLHFLHLGFPIWMLIVAAVFMYLMFKAYREQSYNFALSIFVFIFVYRLYFESFDMVRQMMAMAVWLFVLPCMQKREYKKALLLLLITISLHDSAAFMIIFLPFMFVRFSRYLVIPILLLSILVFPILFKAILLAAVPYLPFDTFYIEEFMFDAQEGSGTGLGYWLNTFFAFYLVFRQKDLLERDSSLLPYINSWYFVCFLSNSFSFFQVADRFMYYMFIFFPILIANLFERGRRIDRWLVAIFMLYQMMVTSKSLFGVDGYTYNYQILLKDKDAPNNFWISATEGKEQTIISWNETLLRDSKQL